MTVNMSSGIVNVTNVTNVTNEIAEWCAADPLSYYNFSLQAKQSSQTFSEFSYAISLGISIFGTIGNIICMIVLTRKGMVTSTNILLAGLAFADFVVVFSYIPYILLETRCFYSFEKRLLSFICDVCHAASHCISVWLTMIISVWRFMAVYYPAITKEWRSIARAKVAVVATFLSCILVSTPTLFFRTICTYIEEEVTVYHYCGTRWFEGNGLLSTALTWWMILGLLSLPCIPVIVMTLCLIRAVYKKEKMSAKFASKSRIRKGRQKTKTLLAILIVFVITNLSIRIHQIVSSTGVLEMDLLYDLYFLGAKNAAILSNSSFNVIIYFLMSEDFRKAFRKTFMMRRGTALGNERKPTLETEESRL